MANEIKPTVSEDLAGSSQTIGIQYRCVCGQVFQVHLGAGGVCPSCSRRVTGPALLSGTAGTVSVALSEATPTGPIQEHEEAEDDPLLGRSFGHFRIMRKLGQGGMGAVYEALDESLQRHVALKVISSMAPGQIDTRHIQRLQQEAIAQARVNHANIVQIYYVGREEDTPFLAMELVCGPTVEERLEDGPLPFAQVAMFAQQIVDALDHAADFDIVHGDIKPSNLLMPDEQTVKLSDFGLARRLSVDAGELKVLAGTPCYLPPEAGNAKATDIRSDIYSLGVTLFEMTFGRLPYEFSGSSLFDYLQIHKTAEIQFPLPWPSSVPQAWRSVLERLLAKSPEDRFQSYDEVKRALTPFRPMDLPIVNRVPRTLAWFVDFGLAHAAQQIFYGAMTTEAVRIRPGAQLVLALAGGIVPVLACLLQARWGTTPGKKLFQLRIVDDHGLRPAAPILAIRAAMQLLPICCATAWYALTAIHLWPIAISMLLSAAVWFALDTGLGLFRRDRRSLHDLILRTRVVLDTGK